MARRNARQRKRTIIVSSEGAGVSILRAINATAPEFRVVAFVDRCGTHDLSLLGGIRVFSADHGLEWIADKVNATNVLLPSNLPGREVRDLVASCQNANLVSHVIPAVDEIVDGRLQLAIREVTIADLLRREPNQLDIQGISSYIESQVVLVTGGAGSIGSELCRQLLSIRPSRLVIVDQSECGVFEIGQEFLLGDFPDTKIDYVVGDCTDEVGMSRILGRFRPDLIFHAAAYKHVPLMEDNPQEAIRNNVFGTQTMVDLASRFGVPRFVLISTDKAVRPTNVMGRTKLLAEKYLQSVSTRSRTEYITVRFGNVLNSAGSVVPTFRKQISAGGPVTVTDPEMRRYFMTIPEAVQLVLQAGAIGDSGDILILDMGEPVRIFDLARDMIALSGLRYPEDIDITFSGIRPGEKLYEELFYGSEQGAVRVHEKIFCAPRQDLEPGVIERVMSELQASIGGDAESAFACLQRLVQEFTDADDHRQSRRSAA